MLALFFFAVTVALALLLAVRYRLAWPPVAVSILGGVPTLYVAWLAVPGVLSPPISGHGHTSLWPPGGAMGSSGTRRAPGDGRRPDACICPPTT